MELWKKIELAQNRLANVIHRTPTVHSDTISKLTGLEVFLKLENLQKTGSFKIRGAYFIMSRLSPSQREIGVVAASAGNHAQGVALALARLTDLMGQYDANILHIVHERAASLKLLQSTHPRGPEWCGSGKCDFFTPSQLQVEFLS